MSETKARKVETISIRQTDRETDIKSDLQTESERERKLDRFAYSNI